MSTDDDGGPADAIDTGTSGTSWSWDGHGSPRSTFDGIETHDDLLGWSSAYSVRAVDEHGMDVALDRVEWTVSTRAKRRAASVKSPTIPGAAVGIPISWESVHVDTDLPGPHPCTVTLTWAAFETFDRDEWTATLRHELVHVEQYQAYGKTDHGRLFKRRAAAVDASLRCPPFSPPRYRFRCRACGATVAKRFRDCPFVRAYRQYRSTCCGARLTCERPDSSATDD